MGIMLGVFDRMGEGDSKKMQKLVLIRAKTNQIGGATIKKITS